MNLTLKLNAKFQPIHRFELEDALQKKYISLVILIMQLSK